MHKQGKLDRRLFWSGPYRPVKRGFVGPKIPNVGIPRAEERCPRPVSTEMHPEAFFSKETISVSDILGRTAAPEISAILSARDFS